MRKILIIISVLFFGLSVSAQSASEELPDLTGLEVGASTNIDGWRFLMPTTKEMVILIDDDSLVKETNKWDVKPTFRFWVRIMSLKDYTHLLVEKIVAKKYKRAPRYKLKSDYYLARYEINCNKWMARLRVGRIFTKTGKMTKEWNGQPPYAAIKKNIYSLWDGE